MLFRSELSSLIGKGRGFVLRKKERAFLDVAIGVLVKRKRAAECRAKEAIRQFTHKGGLRKLFFIEFYRAPACFLQYVFSKDRE